MKSKLFTPVPKDHGDCFVNPPTHPSVNHGFADAQGGGALYPLNLGGSGAPVANRAPSNGGVTTSCRPQYDSEY